MEMRVSRLRQGLGAMVVAAVVAAGAAGAGAEIAKPSPVDILFERKHLSNVEAGKDLVYKFERTVSQAELLGQPFTDDIKIEVKKATADGKRDVVVKVFSGDRARDPHPIDELTGNPILVVFLDRAVASYMSVAGGKIAYLKDKFRSAIRERATVEAVKVKVGDATVDGQRVTVQPYAGDLNAAKMRGFENSKFSFVLSDAVPGQFVEMDALYENTAKDAPRLEERTSLVGAEVVK
jgi:hypothetical protein